MMDEKRIEFFEIFPWNENFETGIASIDEEHQQLVNILNHLAAHLANRSHPATLEKYFDRLADYAHYHFESEEKIWNAYFQGDEYLANHKHAHVSFVSQVVALRQEEGKKPLDDVIQDIVSFLSRWLAYHILDTDKHMAKVVLAIQSGKSLDEAKAQASIEMSGSMQLLIQTVLSMYEKISTRTMEIMREKTLRKQAEAELLRAKEEADRANRSKSEFLANMSHEIRTPMNAIIGLSHLALQMQLDGKAHDYIQKVNASAQSLLRIINDILDFSKIEADKLELEATDFNLGDIFHDLSNFLGIRARDGHVKLMFEMPPKSMMLVGDPVRLEQILSNLTTNAIKFTPGGGEVVVSAAVSKQGSGEVELHFSVRDTGIGISKADQKRLFDSFSQADASTTRKYGGTGLGLAISKRLVGMMGGKIWLESAPGKGSTFHFTAKFGVSGRIIERGVLAGQPSDADALKAKLSGARLLLVEDNEINQDVAIGLLESAGISVDVAWNGQEALERLEHGSYDGVLMDCQMPVMDGYEATQRIRQQERFRELPVIAMTANVMKGDAEKSLAAGMNDHIGKPVDFGEMLRTLARWVTPANPAVGMAPQGQPEQADSIGELPGIDVQAGLARVVGNAPAYRKLLMKFRGNYADFEAQFRAAQLDADSGAARRSAHTLKGVAANIGAVGVQARAAELEQACREGRDDDIEPLLARSVAALTDVMTGLEDLGEKAKGNVQAAGGEPDQQAVREVAARLQRLLEAYDTKAGEVFDEEMNALPGMAAHTDQLKNISRMIGDYDFEGAITELKQLMERL